MKLKKASNQLALLAKNDIPFIQAQLIIRQPEIREIGYIGQQSFFNGCEYLAFSKDNLINQDKIRLKDHSNFEVLMTIIKNTKDAGKDYIKKDMESVFSLILPEYKVNFLPMTIRLSKDGQQHLIDKENFQNFRTLISQIFCLKQIHDKSQSFNPSGDHARAIARKIEEGKRKRARQKGETGDFSLLSRYVSILAVGQKKDINELMHYSVYQLFDEFRRFSLKNEFDIDVKIKLAGGKGSEKIQNWMDDIHS